MRTKIIILLVVGLLLVTLGHPFSISAATVPNTVQIGQVEGVTKAIAYQDGKIFFNVGPRLVRMAVSASAPEAPVKPGTYSVLLAGIPEDIKVANGYAYLALGAGGVAVVDLNTLQVVSAMALPGSNFASGVAVGSKYLYVAAGNIGIVAYDLGADKKTLAYRQTKTFSGPARNITAVEVLTGSGAGAAESLFASANNASSVPANRGGVMKFDITSSPVLGNPVVVKEQIDVNGLKLTDAYVFAAGDNMLYVLDTTNLGTASGGYYELALLSPAQHLVLGSGGNVLFLISGAGIDVVDVSTPSAPVKKTLSPFATPDGAVMDLAAVNFDGNSKTFLYLADFNAGLSIASSPQATPWDITLENGGYVLPKPAITRAVAGVDQQAFAVSDTSSLWTVNTSNPTSLKVIGTGITPDLPISSLTRTLNLLLISSGNSLLKYQINPGSEPTKLDSFEAAGATYQSAVAWPNAVVADGTNGLVVVNLDGPMALTGAAAAPQFDSDFRLVDVQGNFAYVGDNNGVFRIYDLTDPTGPVARGTLAQAGILDLKVSGNYAFLACGDIGLRVVDITNPDAPVLVGAGDYDVPGVAQSLVVSGNTLYVAGGQGGVHILSVLAGGQLDLEQTIPTSGNALQVVLAGQKLYVADENGGLVAIQFGPLHYYMPALQKH